MSISFDKRKGLLMKKAECLGHTLILLKQGEFWVVKDWWGHEWSYRSYTDACERWDVELAKAEVDYEEI